MNLGKVGIVTKRVQVLNNGVPEVWARAKCSSGLEEVSDIRLGPFG